MWAILVKGFSYFAYSNMGDGACGSSRVIVRVELFPHAPSSPCETHSPPSMELYPFFAKKLSDCTYYLSKCKNIGGAFNKKQKYRSNSCLGGCVQKKNCCLGATMVKFSSDNSSGEHLKSESIMIFFDNWECNNLYYKF